MGIPYRNHGFEPVNAASQSALILTLAVALDSFLPEPPHAVHPVVWMGRATSALEGIAPQNPALSLLFGAVIVLAVVGGGMLAAWLVVSALRSLGEIAYVAGGALALRTTFTVRGLSTAAKRIQKSLDEQPEQARAHLRHLVGRDPASLTPSLMAAAAIESVAENTADSFVGPWLAFALFGIPGAVAYRALNTLDSMLGYRGGAYEYLGKICARLDDMINLIPARLSALLLLGGGGLSRLPAGQAWRTMWRDHGLAAGPNAGWTMSAMAGLLQTRLEKPDHYCLGWDLSEPVGPDIGRAIAVAEQAAGLAFLVTLGLLMVNPLGAG